MGVTAASALRHETDQREPTTDERPSRNSVASAGVGWQDQPMSDLLDAARSLWTDLADAKTGFGTDGPTVAVSAGSRLCPPGWVGVVRLGDSAIITVPTDSVAAGVTEAIAGIDTTHLTDPEQWRRRLPVTEVLGPAFLDYLSPNDFTPAHTERTEDAPVAVSADSPELAGLLASVEQSEAEESGLAGIDSPAFVVRHALPDNETHGEVIAAAGYSRVRGVAAHLCVLADPGHRGRGLATLAASAAVEHALTAGLLPQWRARVPESLSVARRLGFSRMGQQLSLMLST